VIAPARPREETSRRAALPRGFRRLWLLTLAPVALVLTNLAAAYPAWTERLYARGLYPVLSGAIGRVTGLLPFSLIEILIYIAIVSAVVFLIVKIRGIVKARGQRGDRFLRLLATVAAILSLWYFLSAILCGLNYHRQTFTEYSGLFVRDSSVEELAALCGELVSTANTLRETLPEDENGVMTTAFASPYEGAAFAGRAYGRLGADYPLLGGYTPRVKPVLSSRAMSHMNIVGIFIPFTYQSSVNIDVADYNIPSSMMHELSHYKGFMREDEANFIAWLACTHAENAEFAYSGTLLALLHATNALYDSDEELYREIMSPLSDAVRRDFAANNAYWKQFEGPVSTVSTAVNNTYLRANKQTDGVKSYGRMVDLLLAEYRERHGLV
jgi:hypothetical protein